MHQHVFSFEGIRARESFLSAHPPSPSICLSLSPPFKGGAKGQFNFFRIHPGEIEKKGEKRTEGQSSNAFFVLDEFWTIHLCCYVLVMEERPRSEPWSLALSR